MALTGSRLIGNSIVYVQICPYAQCVDSEIHTEKLDWVLGVTLRT